MGSPPNEWYEFEVSVGSLAYPIIMREDTRYAGVFKQPDPEFDWCAQRGRVATAYHYDRIRGGILRLGRHDAGLSSFERVCGLERGGIWGVAVLGLTSLFLIAMGIDRFAIAVKSVVANVQRPTPAVGPIVQACARFLNESIVTLVCLGLASVLSVVLGLILVKGMLYVETGSNLLTGLIVVIGGLMISLGPGVLLGLIHAARRSEDQRVIFVRNLFATLALFQTLRGAYTFLADSNFPAFNKETTLDFFLAVASSVFG